MADVTVSQFAEVLKVPVERLLTQLDEAGIRVSGADDTISDDAKMELLTFLRRAHGRTQDTAAPRKITLQRKSQGEIKVASAQGRARMVNVEVRSKKTYLNRSVLEERARVQQEEVDRAKQEVEKAKHDVEKVREAEARQRLQLEEEAKRRADEEARVLAEEEARRQAEARERQEAERRREQETAAKAREPERERAAPAQRAELHVSSDASARFKKKKQHQASRSRRPVQVNVSTQHGFERPAAPVKRDVQIGETVTVAELAQRMAVKANEVIKVMMNMGVMATINQPIDQDTAVLVVEELGHSAVIVKENAIEDELQ